MSLRDQVTVALRTVRDPELPVSVYDLGLIYEMDADPDGVVSIRMTLTAPNCPVADRSLVRWKGPFGRSPASSTCTWN
jgi:metal-sulfur cluster biosynthetic enzyme